MKKTKSRRDITSLKLIQNSPEIKCSVNPSNLIAPVRVNTNHMRMTHISDEIINSYLNLNSSYDHIKYSNSKLSEKNEIKSHKENFALDNIFIDRYISMKKSYIKILVSPNNTNKYFK
jgi:hypothetical protein